MSSPSVAVFASLLLFLSVLLTRQVSGSRHRESAFGKSGNSGNSGNSGKWNFVKGDLADEMFCRQNRTSHEETIRMTGDETTGSRNRSRVEVCGEILKRHVHLLRKTANRKVELVFLVDSSASVGSEEFLNELKFVKKLLADFTVDRHTTRVSVITFSSKSRVVKHIDHMTNPKDDNHKCSLLEEELPKIEYTGGGTHTIGALIEAQTVFRHARPDAKKALFLITDGYSNGGDPLPEAEKLKKMGVEIFTFGIREGNFRELCDMASSKKEEHTYILNTFEEFEVLARRALHEDLHVGNYVIQNSNKCNSLCEERKDCCDSRATCRCGTHTGKYECVCQAGYYGSGVKDDGCLTCPEGTYKNYTGPGDKSTCIACPDPNQSSPPGSVSIDQCHCRKGYRSIGAHACAAKTCPDLTPPENGYFVQGQCSNDVNAACGMRCKSGYTLHGTSLRLCTEEGVWTGMPVTCEVKRCPVLSEPLNGQMDCTKNDYSFDTHCHFHCHAGYRLVGSKSQSCLAIALWSGIHPKCREIKCPELKNITDARVNPDTCTTRESSYGTVCTFVCHPGYKMTGPRSKQCMESGKWAPEDGTENQCVDITPPTITCPSNITVNASADENFGTVTWELPAVSDNSLYLPSVTVLPTYVPPVQIPIGENLITYTAEDGNRNKARCTFAVIVRDTQRPRVDKCISPAPFMMGGHASMNITWEEPIFSDNSFQPVKIVRSRGPGVFPLGTTAVTYTATDKDGNTVTCDIKITVQEHACANHPVPLNGNLTCNRQDTELTCYPWCQPGYDFAIRPSEKYFCDYRTGFWRPEGKWPIKDCSVSRKSNHAKQTVEMQFKLKTQCQDRLVLNHLENSIEKKIKQKAVGYCLPNMACDAGQFETTCIDEDVWNNRIDVFQPSSGNQGNAALESSETKRERVRRDAGNIDRRVGVEYQRHGSAPGIDAKSTITVKYDINGSSVLSADPGSVDIRSGVAFVREKIIEDARKGDFDSIFRDEGTEIVAVEYLSKSPEFLCHPGSVLIDLKCVNCPGGTFFNVINEACVGCQRGTYQPEEGQLTCLVCPNNMSTSQNNSRSIQQCRGQCLPGSFSYDGVEWCETCPIGFYQSNYAQTACLPCPMGTKTWRRGSRRREDCGVECREGFVSKTGLEPCFPCPRGYFQPEKGKSSCFVCPEGVKTRSSGSTDITDCEGISQMAASSSSLLSNKSISITDCFAEPCQNGAQCTSLIPGYTCQCLTGWTGLHCEMEIDECLSNPCQNNGSCVDEMSGYSCIDCSPGYSGIHCELNIDDCEPDPCENNATCVDHVNFYRCDCAAGFNGTLCEENIDDCIDLPCKNNGTCIDEVTEYRCQCVPGFQGSTCEVDIDECSSGPCQNNGNCTDEINAFRCGCKSGYTGSACETDINECQSDPCQNGATCLDMEGRYLCRCAPSFTGVDCETKLNSSFDFYFPTSGITDYASIEDPFGRRNLTAFTIAMWLRTDDRENQGTPVSYATDADSNAIVITDYSGFVLYVNGKIQHTDVTADDGNWHHIATTWTSEKGAWQVFKDGLKVTSGTGMVPDSTIEGGGVLVVGQEQDVRGGLYSISESFIGTISRLNLWDYVLTEGDIARIVSSCDENIGNLIAWPDFLSGLNGKIERINSHICRGCDAPVNITSGSVQWTGTNINATASYSCASGYELDGPADKICLLNSSWSGIELRCTKVSCGLPPDIPNGNPFASYNTYGNKAEYFCSHGYELVGNQSLYCNASGIWEGQIPKCVEIICTLLPLTTGLRLTSSRSVTIYRPDDVARFDCQPGHRMTTAHRSIKCTRSGRWDNAMPRCDPIICDPVPSILNGRVSVEGTGNDTTFHPGQTLSYSCDVGYEPPIADNRIRCNEGGTWTSTHRHVKGMFCQVVTCVRPSRPKNGWVEAQSYSPVFDSTAVYRCDDGYVRFGPAERKCQSNGTWSGIDTTCQVITCPRPGEILHGRVIGTEFLYRGKITYTCDEGYELSGTVERTCGSDGSWSSPEPSCRPVECPRPGNLTHGHVFGDTFTYNSVVDFTCESGFQLAGAKQQRCLANGTWSDETPTCEKVLCSNPIDIPNGRHEGSMIYETGSVITYVCHKGYEIEGKDTRTCRLDGTWSGPTPKCNSIHCVFPSSIKHGRYQSDQNVIGSTIEYQCDSGYALDGPTNRTCSDDKKWTGSDPSCQEVLCEKPPGIAHGSVNGDVYRAGSSIFYKCEPGYRLNGSSVRFCTENTKVWNGTQPHCVPVDCGKPTETIVNGGIMSSNFSYGAVIQYACDNGYQVQGMATRTCKADGTWSKEVPVCERVECPRPARVIYAMIEGSEYKFRDKVVYSCVPGYTLSGHGVRVCQADKTWNGSDPHCAQIDCKQPPVVTHGRIITQGTHYKNIAHYICDPKYRLTTNGTRYCTENGSWSGVEPQCVELNCGQPPAIENGRPTGDVIKAGMTVEYKCDDGFRLVQSAKLTCSLQGQFSGNRPRCEKVECPTPQPIDFGRLNYTNITLNSVLRYVCDFGYELVGPSERVCGEDRQWTGVDPICLVVDCGPPDFVGDTHLQMDRYDLGAVVVYACFDGFLLESGDLNRTCLADKRWSGDPPVCKKISCPRPAFLFGFIAIAAGDTRIEQHVHDIDRFVYGMTVEFDCEDGFRLQGERELTCLVNGSWNGPIPSCDRISCPNVTVANGQVLSPKGFKYGFRTLVSCDEGYEISGSKELNCLSNGTWSSEIPTCQPITCEEPPGIEDMYTKIIASPNAGVGYPFGMTLGFDCHEGFELLGATKTTCLATKQWSTPFPLCQKIVCSPPLIEGKSNPILENPKDTYGLGETLRFRCAVGYHLDGMKDIACNENRTWNGTIPRCVQSVCPPLAIPHALFNGSVPDAKDLFGIGKSLAISCEDGYRLNGISLLRCTENGKWHDTLPTCVIITCLLPEISNSETRSENVTVGRIVWINCKPGYRLVGASPVTCLKSAGFSLPLPECIMITCPEFSVPDGRVILRERVRVNGRHDFFPIAALSSSSPVTYYKQGESAEVVCDDGFTLAGNGSNGILTCQVSGSWSAAIPACEKILCPTPEIVNNSRIEFVQPESRSSYEEEEIEIDDLQPVYAFGTIIKYVCDSGYRLVGEMENMCTLDGTWSEPFPKCELIHCTSLIVPNAVLSTKATSFGTVVNVTCKSGYEIFGEAVLTCQASGLWSGIAPVCFMVACKVPKIPFARLLNTSTLPDTANYGNKIAIECLEGFRMLGPSQLTCGDNKNWMPGLPTCERRRCRFLNLNVTNLRSIISHGVANNESRLPFGTEVSFQCEPGFRMNGRASIRCDANETWSGLVPNCTQVFCQKPFIENGNVHLGIKTPRFIFGHSIRFSCHPGFQLVGESEMLCQPEGDWSAKFPRCIRLSCPEIPRIRNGTAFGDSTLFEAVVRYQCETGFDLIGNSSITCLADQMWSSVPSCQRVKCPTPLSIQNGDYMVNFAFFAYESTVRYACHHGYEIQGQKDITCQANGQWNGEAPSCNRISCLGPPFVPHADVIGDSYLFRDTLQIKCHEGYRLSGAGIIECLSDRTWSKVTATCKIITCGEPPFVRFSSPLVGKLDFNSTVRYVCNVGYEIVGNTETTCLANASWTAINTKCVRIRCSTPVILQNGLLSAEGHEYRRTTELLKHREFYFEDRIVHLCNRGYELFGSSTQTCMSDGHWSGSLARCDPVECTRPPTLRNAYYLELLRNTYTFGQALNVHCEKGYLQKGSSVIACQYDQTWNTSEILCEKVRCSVPGYFLNGGIKGTDFTYGAQITYGCLEGYLLVGERSRTCGANGRWEGTEPLCKRITCPNDDVLANGYIEGRDHSYQAVRLYRCMRGYRLVGDSRRTCQSDGQWSGRQVECLIVSCGLPERPDNGYASVNHTTYESVAEHRCDKGYELYGDKYRMCDHNGWWTGFVPTCVMITCIEPPPLPNGRATYVSRSLGSVVTYTCNSRYALVGVGERWCEDDRMWSGETPVCRLRVCPDLRVASNVRFLGNDFSVGSTVEFYCGGAGYAVTGKRSLVCLQNETWNGRAPTCERVSCPAPPALTNAVVATESYRYGDVVTYACHRGYRMQGEASISCDANGRWSNVTAVCNAVWCGDPPPVQNAKAVVDGQHFRDRGYYVCNEGYDMHGSNVVQCSADEVWTGSLPHCELVTCGVVPVIPHASTIVHKTTYGSKASYECNRGYILRGSSLVECKANGTWAYENRPICVPVECGDPPPIRNGDVRAPETSFDGIATYFCFEGFKLIGKPVVHCADTGQWSGTGPRCDPVVCSSPDPIANGYVFGSEHSFGHSVLYSCKSGYTIAGSNIRTCQPDGIWSGIAPKCELVYCEAPDSPENGQLNFTGLHFGSEVKYWCSFGYLLSGVETATCESDGNWTSPAPTCVPEPPRKKCLPLPSVKNSVAVPRQFIVGDTVTIECMEGYIPTASLQVTCQDDLAWSGLQGQCEKVTCQASRRDSMVVIHGYKFHYGDRAVYTCRQGLIPVTDPVLTCKANGQWDKTPECRASCKFECRNGGTCVGPNKCKCQQGYGGRFCETAICILPCLNGGHCVAPYKCECTHGYAGFRCEQPTCAKPCQNGGRCFVANRCLCPHGFVPPFCESSRMAPKDLRRRRR